MRKHRDYSDFIFIHPHLNYGGAEKQTVLTANSLISRGKRVTIFLHKKQGGLLAQLDSKVNVVSFFTDNHFLNPLAAIYLLVFLAFQEKTIVIAKLWSSVFVLGMVSSHLKHRMYFYENLDPKEHTNYIKFGKLKKKIISRIFKASQFLIANSEKTKEAMLFEYGLTTEPEIIFPCVDVDRIRNLSRQDSDYEVPVDGKPTVVSIGRLTYLKGLDIGFEVLKSLNIPVRWIILGEGELAYKISQWSMQSGQIEILTLGALANPYTILKKANVLLHCSRTESFGAVFLEAIALEVPVVATETSGSIEIAAQIGNAHIFQVGNSGNIKALSAMLHQVLQKQIPQSAWVLAESRLQKYSLARVTRQWLEIREKFEGDFCA